MVGPLRFRDLNVQQTACLLVVAAAITVFLSPLSTHITYDALPARFGVGGNLTIALAVAVLVIAGYALYARSLGWTILAALLGLLPGNLYFIGTLLSATALGMIFLSAREPRPPKEPQSPPRITS